MSRSADDPDSPAGPGTAEPDPGEVRSPGIYAWYVVIVLMLANVSGFIDRQVISLLVDPIKSDLALSDTQVSWLGGLAFAAFYSVLGFPIGRLADVRSRRAIIGWGAAVWSVMCAMSGLARGYWQLFLARMGVGVGEASLTPPAFSLIADYFPQQRLSSAMSLFGVGIFLGSGLAYWIGGAVIQLVQATPPWHVPMVGELRPWQTVLVLVGAPGIAVALLLLTVREPRRSAVPGRLPSALPMRTAFGYVRAHPRAFSGQGIGFAIFALVNYGTAFWFPAFFERSHDWTIGQVGVYMGGATVIFGSLGILAGGRLSDWLKQRGRVDGDMQVGIMGSALALAAAIPLYTTRRFDVLIAGLIVTNIAAALPWGAAAAALQEMTPSPMRAQISALYLFLVNMIGALGPTAVALFTDRVFHHEAAMVASSLLLVTVAGRLLSIVCLWYGLQGFRGAVRAATEWKADIVGGRLAPPHL